MDAIFEKINELLDKLQAFIAKIFGVVDELGQIGSGEGTEE